MKTELKNFENLYSAISASWTPRQQSHERELRNHFWKNFLDHGVPNVQKQELWKYSSFKNLDKFTLVPLQLNSRNNSEASKVGVEARAQVVVDLLGEEVQKITLKGRLPASLQVMSTTDFLNDRGGIKLRSDLGREIEALLVKESGNAANAFANLNGALFSDGVVVYVAPESGPISILLRQRAKGAADQAQISGRSKGFFALRNAFLVDKKSKVSVLELIEGCKEEAWISTKTAIEVREGGHVKWSRFSSTPDNNWQILDMNVDLKKSTQLQFFSATSGAEIVRQYLQVQLLEENANAEILGLSVGNHESQNDFRSVLNHISKNTKSDQYHKGIYSGKSKGIFNGKIAIAQDAQQVVSRQINKNLLLSTHAEVDTKPELEIFADDVKATHGATVGQLDPEQLFYLQSRGFSKQQSHHLLLEGFGRDVIAKIENSSVRDYAEEFFRSEILKLEQGLSL